MTKLTDKEVMRVAKLAKLKISKSDLKKFKGQLSEIISYVDKLSEVDTLKVKETSRIVESENIFRKDEVGVSLRQDDVLSGTDNTHNGYFAVPAILENKDEDV